VALSPSEPEFHYRLGLVLLESEHYDGAVPPLLRARELAPHRDELLLPLAKAQSRTGDRQGAVQSLGQWVRARPAPQDVPTARALMESISDPFARFPQSARARLEEGLLWLHERDIPQQAILSFEQILRDYPDLAVVRSLLGLCYQRIDDAGRAVEEFKRAIELSPHDGRNHHYLGLLYQSRQRPDQARPYFERAIALHPLLDEAWLHLGDGFLERGDLERAGEAFRVLTSLAPDALPPRGKYALVLQLQKDHAAADRELRRVVERDPDNLEFTLRLGMLHLDRWKHAQSTQEREAARAESERWLRKVLQAQPQNAIASRALQTLRAR
jgi:tetratricopeptide (TPR) repeat protein